MFKAKCMAVVVSALMLAGWNAQGRSDDMRHALDLFGRGMYEKAGEEFYRIAGQNNDYKAEGYAVLCDVCLQREGYTTTMSDYISRFPYSGVIPQMRYRHALNLFQDEDYEQASETLEEISRHQLYRSQVTEYLFHKAYCDLETGVDERAIYRFKEVISRPLSDYTAPSRYFLGYILYQQEKFPEAAEHFIESAKDPRFAEISNYYILECRFMGKDYEYVVVNGPKMMESVPEDRKSQLSRLISESYLVLGNAPKAREYYNPDAIPAEEKTRTDYFYAGSLLYAVKDWKGAADNLSMMTDHTDSIGQIAAYQLAFSYIQLKNKVAALDAFKEAAGSEYDPVITEDAHYNYAKLAFDLNNDITGFESYLDKYSDRKRGDRIYAYMAVGALRSRDYASAVEAYDKVEDLDPVMKVNYMKANYLRANELIEGGSWRAAVPCLRTAAYYSDRREMFNQLSRFWLAEAYYRDAQYDKSLQSYRELYNTSALDGMDEGNLIAYGMAWCYFQQKDYISAQKWFAEYLGSGSGTYRKDAMLRQGDCAFLQRDYVTAQTAYTRVTEEFYNPDDIYPYYSAALCSGLRGDNQGKIKLLSEVRNASASAPYYADATLELGRAYALAGSDAQAGECFRKVVENVKDSNYVSLALIELGTLARNARDLNAALLYYRRVVEQMPLSQSTQDALAAIENIYQSQNNPKGYLAYIDSIGMSTLKTDQEKQNMIFSAAEQIFLSGNYEKAMASFKSYIEDYPRGKDVASAKFYLAECSVAMGQKDQACDYYSEVMTSGSGSFVEVAALKYSDLSYSLQQYEDAFKGYSFLKENAQIEDNKHVAAKGMMRSAYAAKMWEDAIANAGSVETDSRSDESERAEAQYIKAKSYIATSQRQKALPLLSTLSSSPDTEYGAEASYLLIKDSYDRGDFADVETRVYAFSESGNPVQYWLAKSFVILGDAFAEQGDLEQAKATFESVRDGYNPAKPDDVKDDLDTRIQKITELIENR